jgi:predicted TIM-barrel fold metal-dependent hydrolase
MVMAIDFLCNHFTADSIAKNYLHNEEEAARFAQIGLTDNLVGNDPEVFLAEMSTIGVEKLLVPSIVTWSYWRSEPVEHTTPEEVIEIRKAAPERIFGLYGVDVRKRMDGVRELEMLVREHDFRGIHIHPHGFGFPPDHAYYFPFYAKCEELGVPVVISMGHTVDLMPIENGKPIHLDKIALYFPNLKIVCAHTGWPWVEEAIALAWKHPNVFIGTSAYKPKNWSPQLVKFINSWGKGKVMWGTDFPLIMQKESIEQVKALGLKPEAEASLLHGTAQRVFGL